MSHIVPTLRPGRIRNLIAALWVALPIPSRRARRLEAMAAKIDAVAAIVVEGYREAGQPVPAVFLDVLEDASDLALADAANARARGRKLYLVDSR